MKEAANRTRRARELAAVLRELSIDVDTARAMDDDQWQRANQAVELRRKSERQVTAPSAETRLLVYALLEERPA